MIDNSSTAIAVSSAITLDLLRGSDAAALYHAVEQSREHLSRSMPWERNIVDNASAKHYITQRLNSPLPGAKWFAIYFHSEFAGVFAIKHIDPHTQVCELGYWLANIARGHRVIDSILAYIIPYLRAREDVHFVHFHCLEDNLASINIAQRAGAVLKTKIANQLGVAKDTQYMCIYQLAIKVHT
ncbi:GNAT family N-acetyltransferase [Pseudoalteromonas sp. MM17-2]|nr:GNAT family N-acetyltransferase [Pseudoalteromonas sp. MM17-2]MCG7545046.1 GNAT family N-acetyltransferase [Pseudoalteromonas sp. MM17-2]